ncbi:MAG: transcription elongation factor GreA [Oscillospiraceae bacterium]|jgi:transcription elongation factor GreA|nr:transcription elongation factor GreA [Oscillospiraceae bacterium]
MAKDTATNSRYNMTSEEHQRLGEDIRILKTVRMAEVAEQLKIARSFGDLSENSEYDEAKTEQGKLNSEIIEKEDLFENANIIEISQRMDVVGLGRRVTLKNTVTGAVSVYELVSSQSVDPINHKISDSSPLGRALNEQRVGDIIEYDAPSGKFVSEITAID